MNKSSLGVVLFILLVVGYFIFEYRPTSQSDALTLSFGRTSASIIEMR
jgi:hypothetical protein